ncbi:four helix bundle protein [Candidatus Shapirobacteria bacterium CG08_land_8_20_14_0_20_39_18]|uniref:Four helix bundle protein n=1 Tax=Candidatus Shapirobacteria bacterium CG08_land_8_20_14_0_20_39_18 TaxID=1974883 RepID=A0A2M6XDP0_9BACT|nr:MAG: four helix bundle protein [Candidatus Shapirobacteria bacterium CG08_land_8_20_14_0_20_39_18]PJE68546.1 MAG: four helix bundle protein [Candidatus Shapirobacteria bacterium CG10_big_fil_rev_8_21_14_0_10_38_8]
MTEIGYKYLKTYQLSIIIFDSTYIFCERFLPEYKFRRTVEQMTQAARSMKQNIPEGYSETSLKSYIKLLGVSRGSVVELIEDYQDFLRLRGLKIWDKNDPRVLKIRDIRVIRDINDNPNSLNTLKLPDDPESAANFLLTLCFQESFLLNQQIKSLEEKFVNEGGYTENLYKKRIEVKYKR